LRNGLWLGLLVFARLGITLGFRRLGLRLILRFVGLGLVRTGFGRSGTLRSDSSRGETKNGPNHQKTAHHKGQNANLVYLALHGSLPKIPWPAGNGRAVQGLAWIIAPTYGKTSAIASSEPATVSNLCHDNYPTNSAATQMTLTALW